ncbi:hypothetical protein VPH35_064066 [Triticum aestivum]
MKKVCSDRSASIPEDVVVEILARVKDAATLFRCAPTCKGWQRLILAHACLNDLCAFVGFFTQEERPREGCTATWFIPAPCPVPAVLDPRRRLLSSLAPSSPCFFFDNTVPLTSCHGLLLLRLDCDSRGPGAVLAVFDPLAGTLRILPSFRRRYVTGYDLLTEAYYPTSSSGQQRQGPFFKVLIITIHKKPAQYNLHTLSSADNSGWKKACSGDVLQYEHQGIRATHRQRDAAVCDGKVHRVFCGASGIYTLDLWHTISYQRCLARLMLVCLHKDGRRIETWTSDRSFQTSNIDLKQEKITKVYTCLGENSGTILVINNYQAVYVVNVNTGVMEQVTELPYSHGLTRPNTVLLQIDWPTFFASRLGVVAM